MDLKSIRKKTIVLIKLILIIVCVGITRCGTVHSIGFVIFVGILLCLKQKIVRIAVPK
jgi:hypothetical protein